MDRAFKNMDEKDVLGLAADAFNRKLIVISPDFEILAANRYFKNLVREECLGKRCHEVLYDRPAPCKNCPAVRSLSTGYATGQLDGREVVELNGEDCLYCIPICEEDEIQALLVLDLNIPAIKGFEKRLDRSNAFLRNLILSSVDGVIAADRKGKILIFNQAAVEISGYTTQEALGRLNIRDVYPGDGAREIMKKLRSEDFGGAGKLQDYQVEVLHKDGTGIPISLNASIVYEKGQEAATIGFFRDERNRLKMEEELKRIQVQLLQAEKLSSLGKLAAGVAHQLNNPLGGIILFTKLMLEEHDLPEAAREDLHRILTDARRSRDTVRELLEFARQTRQVVQPHDINRALGRTLFLLENQAIFQNIAIEKDFAQDLPMVPADIQQLYHVFMNIILNAVQAMGKNGRLTLSTGLSRDEGWVEIRISDTGPGIPADVLPHIFEPFYTTKEEGKGTGLGLSLAYNIVQNHKGRISAESEPGKGTVFTIELPIKESTNGKQDPSI